MEPLASYGIKIGAGVALELIKKAAFPANVEKEINIAFKRALKKWCKNWFIRRIKKRELKNYFEEVISQPTRYNENNKFIGFYDLFAILPKSH